MTPSWALCVSIRSVVNYISQKKVSDSDIHIVEVDNQSINQERNSFAIHFKNLCCTVVWHGAV